MLRGVWKMNGLPYWLLPMSGTPASGPLSPVLFDSSAFQSYGCSKAAYENCPPGIRKLWLNAESSWD
jgi:hypothetical protein